jgi:antitoxin ChpS
MASRKAATQATGEESQARAASPLLRTTLKKAGGSLALTGPARVRDVLQLSAGMEMSVSVEGNRLVLEATRAPQHKYTLDELMAQCDLNVSYTADERRWLDEPPVGREVI